MRDGPTTTQLLQDVRSGDRAAFDALFPRVYDELKVLAHARLRRHGGDDSLNTTALVHETYLKLTTGETPSLADRAHFFALAARAMRFILVSFARERNALKRGGGTPDVELDESALTSLHAAELEAADLLSLDNALHQLSQLSERLAQVVELRFFGGMPYGEMAEVTGRSEATLKREWRRARAWLHLVMRDGPDGGDPPGSVSANVDPDEDPDQQ